MPVASFAEHSLGRLQSARLCGIYGQGRVGGNDTEHFRSSPNAELHQTCRGIPKRSIKAVSETRSPEQEKHADLHYGTFLGRDALR